MKLLFFVFVVYHQPLPTFCVVSTKKEETCKKYNCDNIDPSVRIHWELNGLHQNDITLIKEIKTKVLWVMKCHI